MGAQATIQGNSSHLDVVVPQIYIFHIYTWPKFTQIPNLHGTQIYTNPYFHNLKFTQPDFTQTQIYTATK